MGRHAAPVGAGVHPLVAAALAQREAAGAARRSASADQQHRGGPVGWPGREDGGPAGAPVGWPGPASDEPAERSAETPAEATPRGWRRLFGGRAA